MEGVFEAGELVRWVGDKSYGFIKRPSGPDCFVHRSQWPISDSEPEVGTRVRFRVEESPRGPRAADVELVF